MGSRVNGNVGGGYIDAAESTFCDHAAVNANTVCNRLATVLFLIHLPPSHITHTNQNDMESAEELVKRDCAKSMT